MTSLSLCLYDSVKEELKSNANMISGSKNCYEKYKQVMGT